MKSVLSNFIYKNKSNQFLKPLNLNIYNIFKRGHNKNVRRQSFIKLGR